MKYLFTISILVACLRLPAQELYVYTEPASNVPARSISGALTLQYISSQFPEQRPMQRLLPAIKFGLSKSVMITAGASFADMHTRQFRWESVYLYGKYRFLSKDELHSHFRMAVFGEVAKSRSPFHYDEVSLQGDRSGALLGVVATQLWNKLAISGSVSHTQVFDKARRKSDVIYVPSRIYQYMNYSLSAGYLVLPVQYTSYKQTNLNLYAELLAQQSLDRRAYFVDLAPAVQLIFNSNTKVNLGYRFKLATDMERMGRNSFQLTIERTLLNAIGGNSKVKTQK